MSIIIFSSGYDLFKISLNLPKIHGSTIGMFFYIIIIGYELILNGYLNNHGWIDYSIQLKQKEELLNEKLMLLRKAKIDSVVILSQTIEAKDPYTRGHCLRVRDFAKAVAREMNFNKDRIHMIEFGALLHDVGKIGIPGVILNKNSKLSENEYKLIKKHPDIGANIVKNVEYYAPIIPMIKHHHENYDGTGYPDGLKGDEIPIEARILAIGDVFDALTSNRPYRRAISTNEALSLLKELAGKQLDPYIVDIFIKSKIYELIHQPSMDKLEFEF
jgi:putative nucleotidyltransferase with HDIG domain